MSLKSVLYLPVTLLCEEGVLTQQPLQNYLNIMQFFFFFYSNALHG